MIVSIAPWNSQTASFDESRRLRNVISCEIARDATDETSLLESATIKLEAFDFEAGKYAIDVLEDDTRTRLGVFTLYLINAEQTSMGGMVYELAGVSALYPASTSYVTGGFAVIKGNEGASTVRELLHGCWIGDIAPFLIAKTQVYNGDVTKLGAAWSILRAANMCMQITENGYVNVISPPTTAVKTISMHSNLLLDTVSVGDTEVSYTTPVLGRPYDLVNVSLPTFGIVGTRRIANQEIDLADGLVVDETLKEKPYDDED